MASSFVIEFMGTNSENFSIKTKALVSVSNKKWLAFAEQNKGQTICIRIHRKHNGRWETHPDLFLHIAEEPIDRYVWYRLIEPLYDVWRDLGIYQYDLQTLEQREIFSTQNTQHTTSCMNCHTFANYDANTMLLHLRKSPKGTLVLKNDTFQLINNRNPNFKGLYSYASWHRNGTHAAFSANDVNAAFSTSEKQLMHVFDFNSSIGVMNLEKQTLVTSSLLNDSNYLVTFPYFDPSGNFLYFCRSENPKTFQGLDPMRTLVPHTFYNIVKIEFNPETDRLGTVIEPVVVLDSLKKSAAFPRPSPDGRYILYTATDYGCFPIWHHEADLWLFDTKTGENRCLSEINSEDTESYHSWSSNGRWMVFSSRRMNGLYTRLYLSYFNSDGTFSKPLLLPQKNPNFYQTFTKSYNLPEFTVNAFSKTPQDLKKASADSAKSLKTVIL